MPTVVVFDYGFGNVRSAVRALEKNGAHVELTSDRSAALDADGLVVPGVGAFAACMAGILVAGGDEVIAERLAANKPVLGICVGLQIMFTDGIEHGIHSKGLGYWGGRVERLDAPIVPHMGWSKVSAPVESRLFQGLADERFYFVHSYGATSLTPTGRLSPSPSSADESFGWLSLSKPPNTPTITYSDAGDHEVSVPFIAAVEQGPLSAVQFHPEKSGTAGLTLLNNWLNTL